MRALLDTHTFLWWVTNDSQLSRRAHEFIGDNDNSLFFSAASGWEIAIKTQIGKLQLADEPTRFIPQQLALNAIVSLPINLRHALHVFTLPRHHRDPFDRILVAQSQLERLPILTDDPLITQYAVEVIW
jgi:PIN domain nuclease of toxin-antitoxin system